MFKHKKRLSILLISLTLTACSKNTGVDALDTILASTETENKERTIDWYSSQDRVRADVLDTCYQHFMLEVQKKAETENPNIPRLIYDMNKIESNFDSIPDCKNALEATNATIKKEYENKAMYDFEINDAREELSDTTSIEEIERLSAEVAESLLKHQENSINAETSAEQKANEYLVKDGKIDQIMNIDDETLNSADKALEDFAKTGE